MAKPATLIFFFLAMTAYAANWPEHPQLHAVRIAVAPPVIDGDLSDPAWQNAPEFTDFTQHDPDDTKPPTMRTSIRIVYDDNAIYFGAKMSDPQRPTARLFRRDEFGTSDFLSINIDPQLDRLSGNAFTITPANVQLDTVLYNDIGEDGSWDGVWESATKIVPDGWVAEVRIPFSQLRFPDRPVHVWGLNITRRSVRNNEWVRVVNTPKGQTGFVSHFADIVGIEGIHRGRAVEVVPYAVTRSDVRTRVDPNDPLVARRDARADGGVDLKYALTSSLTLTGTLNPDFGQVEVDPAVVNLTQFETFYPEKRPFFTEGLNIFRFGDTPAPSHFNFFFPPSLFYTRRIGRAPQGTIDADFIDAPGNTRILGAAKLTGKLPAGWTIGVLDALTNAERARFVSGSLSGRQHVEPMTNYFVSRMTKVIGSSSRVGFMLTSVNRRLGEDLLSLRRSALTGGVDGYTRLGDQSWILEGSAFGSRVTGTAEAIAATQEAPARYFQRPDARHIHFDPNRTSLSGWGGIAMLSKSSGVWRPIIATQTYSPGFETNDIGFMQRTGIKSTHVVIQYVNQVPSTHFREKNLWFGAWLNRDFDGDTLERGFIADWFATTLGYWKPRLSLFVTPGAFDDTYTRGGPIVRTPFAWSSDLSLGSDDRRNFSGAVTGHLEGSRDKSYARTFGVSLIARPASNLQLKLEPAFRRSLNATQYVTAEGGRYVFAHLDQRSFELGTRADWTLSARLSLQLYLQPFIASGDYHDFRALAAPRTRDYTPTPAPGDANFNFRSIRGSAVARWEFRPGSALYLAWNENRAGVAPIGDFRFGRDLRAIPTAPSHDVFLVKISYWLPL